MPERDIIAFLIKLEHLRGQVHTLKGYLENGVTDRMKRRLRADIRPLYHECRAICEEARHYRIIDKRYLHHGIREGIEDIRDSLRTARKASLSYRTPQPSS